MDNVSIELETILSISAPKMLPPPPPNSAGVRDRDTERERELRTVQMGEGEISLRFQQRFR